VRDVATRVSHGHLATLRISLRTVFFATNALGNSAQNTTPAVRQKIPEMDRTIPATNSGCASANSRLTLLAVLTMRVW